MNHRVRVIQQSCVFNGQACRAVHNYETWRLAIGTLLFRAGLPSRPDFIFLADRNSAQMYVDKFKEPLSTYTTTSSCDLFVMSPQNLRAVAKTLHPSSRALHTIIHVTGLHLQRGHLYSREVLGGRGGGRPLTKSRDKRQLELHSHNYVFASNRDTPEVYASLRLAMELKSVLQPLGFNGWVYPNDQVSRAGFPFTMHPEVLLWDYSRLLNKV